MQLRIYRPESPVSDDRVMGARYFEVGKTLKSGALVESIEASAAGVVVTLATSSRRYGLLFAAGGCGRTQDQDLSRSPAKPSKPAPLARSGGAGAPPKDAA